MTNEEKARENMNALKASRRHQIISVLQNVEYSLVSDKDKAGYIEAVKGSTKWWNDRIALIGLPRNEYLTKLFQMEKEALGLV